MINPFSRRTPPDIAPQDGEAALLELHPLAKKLPLVAVRRFSELEAESDRTLSPIRDMMEERNNLLQDAGLRETTDKDYLQKSVRFYAKEDLEAEGEKRAKIVAGLREKAKQIDKRIAEQTKLWNNIGNLVRNIAKYALSLPTKAGIHVGFPEITGDAVKAAEKLRAKVAALKQERAAIDAAPWPAAVVKAKAIAEIEAAAARGKPNVFDSVEQNLSVAWPTMLFDSVANGQTITRVSGVDAFAVIAWLHRDQLIKMVSAEIEACADDGAALDQQQRDTKHRDVAKRLLSAEREYEAAIIACGYSGAMFRDEQQDPRAVLGLSDDAPAPVDPFS
jgi:hypothetical protein